MSHFTNVVWNVLEDTDKIDTFTGTSKGIITEIREYAKQLEKEYYNQSRITDIRQFIETAIKRDMRE